jgi:hypothetical protein
VFDEGTDAVTSGADFVWRHIVVADIASGEGKGETLCSWCRQGLRIEGIGIEKGRDGAGARLLPPLPFGFHDQGEGECGQEHDLCLVLLFVMFWLGRNERMDDQPHCRQLQQSCQPEGWNSVAQDIEGWYAHGNSFWDATNALARTILSQHLP